MAGLFLNQPRKLVFAYDSLDRLLAEIKSLGPRVLLALDSSAAGSGTARLKELMNKAGLDAVLFDAGSSFPASAKYEEISELINSAKIQSIISFGGIKTLSLTRIASSYNASRYSWYDILDDENQGKNLKSGTGLFYGEIAAELFNPFFLSDYVCMEDARNRALRITRRPLNRYFSLTDPALNGYSEDKESAAFFMPMLLAVLEAGLSGSAGFYTDIFIKNGLAALVKLVSSWKNDKKQELRAAEASFLISKGLSALPPQLFTALACYLDYEEELPYKISAGPLLNTAVNMLEEKNPALLKKFFKIFPEDGPGDLESFRFMLSGLDMPVRLADLGLGTERSESLAEKLEAGALNTDNMEAAGSLEAAELLRNSL
jgi:hypothetical protein